MRKAVLPVVVCQRSSARKKKGRKLSIDSDGTIDMFLPLEILEEKSLRAENPGDARFMPSLCASLKTRKIVELKKKRGGRNRKEKEKRPSISSEGTIVEDLVLSGGQSLSENMQEYDEDFSENIEYSGENAQAILPNNMKSQQKANDKNDIFNDAENIETNWREDVEVEKTGESWGEKELKMCCGSNVGQREERNRLLITFLEDEITSLQQDR